MPNTVTVKAPAKINLTLDVTNRRADGYHDLRMIMQTIDLYDEITISKTGSPDIKLTMNRELPDKIPPEKNLVYQAAALMIKTYSLPYGFQIHLTKNIPAAAGLAGGSADCAATLIGINKISDLALTTEDLCKLGVTLGADVPFCIQKGTMLAEGIGEILTPLPELPPLWILLIKPNISMSTGYVYSHLDLEHIDCHPDTGKAIDAITRKDMTALGQNLFNVLETVTIPEHPILGDLKDFFLQNGAIGSLMSGSGSTVYGLFQDEILARFALKTAQEKFSEFRILLCRTKLPPNI